MRYHTIRLLRTIQLHPEHVGTLIVPKYCSFNAKLMLDLIQHFVDHKVLARIPEHLPMMGSQVRTSSGPMQDVYGYHIDVGTKDVIFSLLVSMENHERLISRRIAKIPAGQFLPPISRPQGATEASFALMDLLNTLYEPPARPRALGTLCEAIAKQYGSIDLYFTPAGVAVMHHGLVLGKIPGRQRELQYPAHLQPVH